MWFNSSDISVEKTNGERNNRPGNEFAQWQRRTRGLTRHLIKKVKNTPTRSIIFGKHERTITDDRKCAQENTDRLETVNSWDKIASGLQKTHRMTPLQRQDRCGKQWCVVLVSAGGIQHVTNASTSWIWTSSPLSYDLSFDAGGRPLAKQ